MLAPSVRTANSGLRLSASPIEAHVAIGNGRSVALTDGRGAIVTRRLGPPGFFALHYGVRTPISVVAAHLHYGGILGAFYRG